MLGVSLIKCVWGQVGGGREVTEAGANVGQGLRCEWGPWLPSEVRVAWAALGRVRSWAMEKPAVALQL